MKSLTAAQQNSRLLKAKLRDNTARRSERAESSRPASPARSPGSAILAVIVSLLLIAFYIALRFDWKFAVPVMVALAHDILITVGVYSLSQREVTTRRSPRC